MTSRNQGRCEHHHCDHLKLLWSGFHQIGLLPCRHDPFISFHPLLSSVTTANAHTCSKFPKCKTMGSPTLEILFIFVQRVCHYQRQTREYRDNGMPSQ